MARSFRSNLTGDWAYGIEDIWPHTFEDLAEGVSAISPASPRVLIRSHHPDAEADGMALAIKKAD